MPQAPVIVWFRYDLRLSDNPALSKAAASGGPVICLYIREETGTGQRAMGAAAAWWLAQSLRALMADLERLGQRLVLRSGKAAEVLAAMIAETGAGSVVWNRRYDAGGIATDKAIKSDLAARGITAESFGANLLREPWEVKSAVGEPMKVFTPFWRAHQRLGDIRAPLRAPTSLPAPAGPVASETV